MDFDGIMQSAASDLVSLTHLDGRLATIELLTDVSSLYDTHYTSDSEGGFRRGRGDVHQREPEKVSSLLSCLQVWG